MSGSEGSRIHFATTRNLRYAPGFSTGSDYMGVLDPECLRELDRRRHRRGEIDSAGVREKVTERRERKRHGRNLHSSGRNQNRTSIEPITQVLPRKQGCPVFVNVFLDQNLCEFLPLPIDFEGGYKEQRHPVPVEERGKLLRAPALFQVRLEKINDPRKSRPPKL